ncbi:MAG TPA: hypothetical protein VKY89_02965 [Thermoanaerobaculia bacterium]|jgi:hypothetical protein|nr:hypothetical protein [Thermoanaerobaculia bacterium]
MKGNRREAAHAAAGSFACDRPGRQWRLAAVLACLAVLAGGPAVAAPAAAPAGGPEAGAPATDAVVAQVVQMLRGGVTEPVIVAWLDKTGNRPATVGSADLVALHQAGASDELLKKLVGLAGGAAPAAAPSPQAAPVSPPPAPAPVPPPAPTVAPPAARPEPAAAAAGPGAAVKVRFAVTYRPVEVVDAEAPVNQRWLLFLYVDGRFVGSAAPGPVLIPTGPRNFDLELAPGRHLLRVTQERHQRYSSAQGYLTPSRVDPEAIPFEVKAGAATLVRLHFGDKSLRHPGPVDVRVEQDGKEVAHVEPATANSESWPALCEDVPAALPAGGKPHGTAQHDLDRCVHWAALWPGIAAVPTRDEVRGESDRPRHPPA